jgi:polyisoprenoid-binding protein YceI
MTLSCQLKSLIFTALLTPIIAQADIPAQQIVPNDSTLTFTATQNNAPVSGSFKTFSGEIHFDPAQLATSNVRILIALDSVTTSYKEVGDTLKTADWFNVKTFPQAIFTADRFTKTGEKTYKAEGKLTIRDKIVPTTLAFSLLEYSKTAARVKGETTLKRTEFGVGQGDWKKTDEVKDEVKVDFVLTTKK